MNKLILPALLAVLPGVAQAVDRTEAEKEAYALQRYRANPRDPKALVDVAQIREGRAKWSAALGTWSLIQKQFGSKNSPAWDGRYQLTYGQLASWWTQRINARLEAPPRPSALQRAAAEKHWQRIKSSASFQKPGRIDLDSDGIPEIVYFLESYNSNGDTIRQLRVDKWRVNQYVYKWSSGDAVPADYTIVATKNWPNLNVEYVDGVNPTLKSIYSNSESIIEIEN